MFFWLWHSRPRGVSQCIIFPNNYSKNILVNHSWTIPPAGVTVSRRGWFATAAEPAESALVNQVYQLTHQVNDVISHDDKELKKWSWPSKLVRCQILHKFASGLLIVWLSPPQVALIHVDAHADTAEHQSHFDLTHGTPFRRAWEDKLLDNSKVFQIGIRGWVVASMNTNWFHKTTSIL